MEAFLRSLSKNVDLKSVCGPTALPDTLVKAGADDADIMIAVSEKDECNLISCELAKHLFKIPVKVARVKQSNYLDPKYYNKLSNSNIKAASLEGVRLRSLAPPLSPSRSRSISNTVCVRPRRGWLVGGCANLTVASFSIRERERRGEQQPPPPPPPQPQPHWAQKIGVIFLNRGR